MRPESSPPRSSAFLTRRARTVSYTHLTLPTSKENRVLFMRRYWYADSFAEIGKLLGITEGNARLRLTRMRKQLKTYLTEQEVLV